MAQRRMFSPKVTSTDSFLDMPVSARELYFQLGMNADDDGFITPKRIMRMIGSSDDDLKVLITKNFVIPFKSGVIVISAWRINNLVRRDWYQETIYKEEKAQLIIDNKGEYKKLVNEMLPNSLTEVRLGKVRLNTNKFSKNENLSVLNEEITIPSSEDEIKEEEKREEAEAAGVRIPRKKDKTAWAICLWYQEEAQSIRKTKANYAGGGYFSLIKLLKEKGAEEVKKILKFYIDSEKFDRHPMLTAALSADSLRIYYES